MKSRDQILLEQAYDQITLVEESNWKGALTAAAIGLGAIGIGALDTSNNLGKSHQSKNQNVSKTWISPDWNEGNTGKALPEYSRSQGIKRGKEIARQMGYNQISSIEYEFNVPSSINGRNTSKYLTSLEVKLIQFARNMGQANR